MKQGGLGRGLSSLIPPKKGNEAIHQHPEVRKDAVFYIDINKIKPNSDQPRQAFDEKDLDDLAQSILKHGILQPLIVSKIEKDVDSGRVVEYQIIAGERRWRAAKIAGLFEVPVIIKEGDDRSKLEMALIENIQRKDLNPMEKSEAFERLQKEYNFTHDKIAAQIGKSREYITNILRLIGLPEDIKQALRSNRITEGHARAILAIKDPVQQKQLFLTILDNKISVRDAESEVRKIKKQVQSKSIDGYLKELLEKLEDKLGTKINLLLKSKGGKIVIEFYSDEDLEDIIKKIS